MRILRYLIVLICICIVSTLTAQVGVYGAYTRVNAPEAEALLQNFYGEQVPFYEQGFQTGISYWFRLKKVRIEFSPELSYARTIMDMPITNGTDTYSSQQFQFTPLVMVYPLDFFGDCDCPTFSKNSPIFQRGFHFLAAPVFASVQHKLSSEKQNREAQAMGLGFILGVGLDFGLSDFITLSPQLRYQQLLNVEWQDLADWPATFPLDPSLIVDSNVNTDLKSWQFGIRIGFRFDDK